MRPSVGGHHVEVERQGAGSARLRQEPTRWAVFSLAPVTDMNLWTMAFWVLVRGGIFVAKPQQLLQGRAEVTVWCFGSARGSRIAVHAPAWR